MGEAPSHPDVITNPTLLLRHVVSFLRHTQSSSSSSSSAWVVGDNNGASSLPNDNNEDDDCLDTVVNRLVSHLQQQQHRQQHREQVDGVVESSCKKQKLSLNDATNRSNIGEQQQQQHQLLSKEHVAGLLLPWAAKQLAHAAGAPPSKPKHPEFNLWWRTLEACLLSLEPQHVPDIATGKKRLQAPAASSPTSKSKSSAAVLTQSTLNKLVPFAAQLACSSVSHGADITTDITTETVTSICRCFSIMVHLRQYRPRLELALELLQQVSINNDGNNDDDKSCSVFQRDIRVATLQLVQRQLQGSTNPKKNFGILSTPEIVSAMSCLLHKDDDDDDDNMIRPLLEEILCTGLFPATHAIHMEGLVRTFMVPSFADPSSKKDPPKKGAATRSKKKPPSTTKDTTTKPFLAKATYQQSLLTTIQGLVDIDLKETAPVDGKQESAGALVVAKMVPLLLQCFIRQSQVWQQNHNQERHTSGKTSSVLSSTQLFGMQFRCWSSLIYPLLQYLQSNHKTECSHVVLTSFRETASLLLKHDIYLPSYEDPEDRNYLFLDHVTSTLLNLTRVGHDAVQKNASMETRTTPSFMGKQEQNEVLCIFHHLLHLNHRLLHERLASMVQFVAECMQSSSSRNDPVVQLSSSRLLSGTVETYQRLRQSGHLIQSFLDAAKLETSCDNDEPDSIVMESILQDRPTCRSFSSAIQNCPPGQIEAIFAMFTEWVTSNVSSNDRGAVESSAKEEGVLRFVIRLFVIVLQSLRIDHHSAPQVSDLCERAMDSTVCHLVKRDACQSLDSQHIGRIKNGLHICGWLVQLHTRCAFWLNHSSMEGGLTMVPANETEVPADLRVFGEEMGRTSATMVLPMLLEAAKSVAITDAEPPEPSKDMIQFFPVLGELQHLACHRIHQLHSMIYRQEQEENSSTEEKKSNPTSIELVKEAKLLVNFVFYAAFDAPAQQWEKDISSGGKLSGVGQMKKAISQIIASWACYSKPRHCRHFLRWLFSTLSFDGNTHRALSSSLFSSEEGGFEQERNVALFLMRDAAFFEVAELSSLIEPTGYEYVLELTYSAIYDNQGDLSKSSKKKTKRPRTEKLSMALTSLDDKAGLLTSDDLVNCVHPPLGIVEDWHQTYVGDQPERVDIDILRRALRILLLLNGMPDALLDDPNEVFGNVDKLIRIDGLMQRLLMRGRAYMSEDVVINVIGIICACRAGLARQMGLIRNKKLDWKLGQDSTVVNSLLMGLHRSSCFALDATSTLDHFDLGSQVISSTGKVVAELFSLCIQRFEGDDKPLCSFFDAIKNVISLEKLEDFIDIQSTDIDRVGLEFARFMVGRIVLLEEHHAQELSKRNSANGLKGRDRCFHATKELYEIAWGKLTTALGTGISSDECGDIVGVSCRIYLFSDLIRFWSGYSEKNVEGNELISSEVFGSTNDKVVTQLIGKLLGENGSTGVDQHKSLRAATFYCIASLSTTVTPILQSIKSVELNNVALRALVKDFVMSNGKPSPVLDAAVSSLFHGSDEGEVQSLLTCLDDMVEESSLTKTKSLTTTMLHAGAAVHVFHLMLISVKGKGSTVLSHTRTRKYMNLSFEFFCKKDHFVTDIWSDLFKEAISLITVLVGKRDVVAFNEQTISVILSKVNTVVAGLVQRAVPRENTQGQSSHKASEIFALNCNLISALWKHYPKQLYGCAPSVVRTLHVLLSETIDAFQVLPTDACRDMTLELSRIFEAISRHKDIFKKHVMGLLLIYIDALESGKINVTAKKEFMPLIYSLLDTCSTFEIQQLDTLMTVTCKALFRPVYQSYQKVHQYQGQY